MRIRRESAWSRRLLAIAIELWRSETALEIRTGINSGCAVPLIEDLIASTANLAAEEVVVANLIEARGARIRCKVSTDSREALVRAEHHRGGVPANDVADPCLHRLVAWEGRLVARLDRVDIGGGRKGWEVDAEVAGARHEAHHQEAGALWAVSGNGALQLRNQPCRVGWIGVGDLLEEVKGLHDAPSLARRATIWG